jgi:hypothetical protein
MIKSIISGYGITVQNSSMSYPYVSPGSNGAGMVRYNSNMQQFEINDGITWLSIPLMNPTIGLSPDAELALRWANKKMQEEQELNELMSQHPGLQELHDKFKMLEVLCRKEELNDSR